MSKELKTIREAIKAKLDNEEVEFKYYRGGGKWMPLNTLFISFDGIDDDKHKYEFRIKLTKPSIDWNHVSDELNFLAIDKDGTGYVYTNKPKMGHAAWGSDGDENFSVSAFKSLDVGNCDWKDSLIERPEC